jgi:NDP-sugar pyrophosphorylase family protein
MNLLLPLHQLEQTLGPGWLHPLAMMPLANSNVLGQILHSALQASVARLSLPTRAVQGEIADWLATSQPELQADYLVVQQTHDPLAAVRLSRSRWELGETLFMYGDAVTDCDLSYLADEPVDIVCVVARPQTPDTPHFSLNDGRLLPATGGEGWVATGTIWFRDGRLLAHALDAHQQTGADEPFPLYLMRQGHIVGAREARLHLPLFESDGLTVRPDTLLAANGRLLSFGRSNNNAIERSYSEEFTVIPPVYIADTAIVESSVIGAQTTIAADATVRNSIISHSIISPGSVIENMVIDHALIGFDVSLIGLSWSSPVADQGQVRPGQRSEGSVHAE